MKIFTLLLSLTLGFSAFAQDSWKVALNGKELLSTGEEKPDGNIVTLSKTDLAKTANFLVKYTEKEPQTGWKRSIVLVDKGENEMQTETGRILTVSSKTLLAHLLKAGTLYIYTWALPTDPELAARIRVRRVHLCTIKLKD
jgi:hypothetical protein